MNITKRRVAFVAALVVSVLAIVTVCGLAGCSSCSRSALVQMPSGAIHAA